MVEDPSSDAVVFWSSSNKNIIVRSPLKFSHDLLPNLPRPEDKTMKQVGGVKVEKERWIEEGERIGRNQGSGRRR
ncbi:hypothetical protein LINGRAHAP2_LOCUS34584 [Linum grandiflorum]